LFGERYQLRPVFEMHAVDVVPFGAPDKAAALENLRDYARHA